MYAPIKLEIVGFYLRYCCSFQIYVIHYITKIFMKNKSIKLRIMMSDYTFKARSPRGRCAVYEECGGDVLRVRKRAEMAGDDRS